MPELAGMEPLAKGSRLSVQPVRPASSTWCWSWRTRQAMAGRAGEEVAGQEGGCEESGCEESVSEVGGEVAEGGDGGAAGEVMPPRVSCDRRTDEPGNDQSF